MSGTAKPVTNEEALLNDFATRCFRDTADNDYIAARLCYRNGLVPQFHWNALQAFEKYLKAIFLYNRIKAKKIGHDLRAALCLLEKLSFKLILKEDTLKLIHLLDDSGRFRYLEISYFTHGPKLLELDAAVWDLRRYCRVLDYEIELPGGIKKNILHLGLDEIAKSEQMPPHKFQLPGGELERIIKKTNDSRRKALVWQNLYFATHGRSSIRTPSYFLAVNSPLHLHPEILETVIEYVRIPKDVADAFRQKSKTSKNRTTVNPI